MRGFAKCGKITDRRLARPREPYELRPGYELLSEPEQKDIENLQRDAHEFQGFQTRNRIYFSPAACELLDRFGSLSFFFASNYQNVALKDKDGELLVNPEVKRVWDVAITTIPQLKSLLEIEFRALLGVTSTESPKG
jgi:hypothetical protein